MLDKFTEMRGTIFKNHTKNSYEMTIIVGR
jgi:hypothetical protein